MKIILLDENGNKVASTTITQDQLSSDIQVILNAVGDKVDKSEIVTTNNFNVNDSVIVSLVNSVKTFTAETTSQAQTRLGINNKVDKINDMGLSTNDFTNAYKTLLDNIDPIPLSGYKETYYQNITGE